MSLKKNMVGKKIYFEGYLCKCIQHLKPHPEEDYLLVERKGDEVYGDGRQVVEYYLLQAGNDTFVLATPKTRRLIKEKEQLQKQVAKIDEELNRLWYQKLFDWE